MTGALGLPLAEAPDASRAGARAGGAGDRGNARAPCPRLRLMPAAAAADRARDSTGALAGRQNRPTRVAAAVRRAHRAREEDELTLSPLATRSYPARRARAEEDCGAAHPVSARPRPDRAQQGVSPAEAQDAGVRGARGRPLPHAADAHARGHDDLAHRRARAEAQRGPDRGDRSRPRPRAPAVRPHRRGGARPLPARALRRRGFVTTSTRCASSTRSSATAPG